MEKSKNYFVQEPKNSFYERTPQNMGTSHSFVQDPKNSSVVAVLLQCLGSVMQSNLGPCHSFVQEPKSRVVVAVVLQCCCIKIHAQLNLLCVCKDLFFLFFL